MKSKGDTLLQKILSDFEKCVNPESAEELGRKSWEMILNYRIEQLGCSNASEEIKSKIISEISATCLSWDTDDATLSTTQKIFNRLASGHFSEAIKLAESSVHTKEEASKTVLQQNAVKSANSKHASNNKTLDEAMKHFAMNRTEYEGRGGKKRAAIDLERLFPPLKYRTYLQHLKKFK